MASDLRHKHWCEKVLHPPPGNEQAVVTNSGCTPVLYAFLTSRPSYHRRFQFQNGELNKKPSIAPRQAPPPSLPYNDATRPPVLWAYITMESYTLPQPPCCRMPSSETGCGDFRNLMTASSSYSHIRHALTTYAREQLVPPHNHTANPMLTSKYS